MKPVLSCRQPNPGVSSSNKQTISLSLTSLGLTAGSPAPPLSSCGHPLLLQWAPLGGARHVRRHQPRIAAPPPPPLPAAAPAPARRPSAPPAERQRLQPLHLLRPPLQGAGQELQHQDQDRPNVFDLVRINMIQAKVKLGRQCGARIIKNIASINTIKLTSTINTKTNKSLPSPHQKQSPSSPLHPQGGGAQPPSAAVPNLGSSSCAVATRSSAWWYPP